jgi:hypothetical protein
MAALFVPLNSKAEMHISAVVTFVIQGIVQSFVHGIFIQNPGDWAGGGVVFLSIGFLCDLEHHA